MQAPDEKGFVTVKWPSENVKYGGIFHTRIADQSENNKNFLKLLLQESQLSAAERKKARWEHRLRDYDDDKKQSQSPPPERARPMVRPKTSRRRSLSEIRYSGVYDVEELSPDLPGERTSNLQTSDHSSSLHDLKINDLSSYRPIKRGEDREKLKEKLQKVMAFGDAEEEVWPKPPRLPPEAPKLPDAKDIRNNLLTQIRERVEWLTDMEFLGEGAKHRDVIKDQIAERMRAIDELGLNSECSTGRTSDSGFSTTRSTEIIQKNKQPDTKRSTSGSPGKTARSNQSAASHNSKKSAGSHNSERSAASHNSKKSAVSHNSKKSVVNSVHSRKSNKEESVHDYKKLTPLQYSPRRRC